MFWRKFSFSTPLLIVETEIPIEPKQSNIPETVIDSVMIISDSSVANPESQKNELLPSLLEPKKVAPADSSQGDSLKLETKKIIKDSAEQDAIPKTEESQLDQESLETNLKKEGDSAKTDSTQSKNSESGNQGTDKQLDITTEKASNDSTSSTDNN